MDFNNKMFDWANEGTEPSESLKSEGFKGGYKPPASVFNNFWSKVTKAIKELQEKLSGHAADTANPHGVTKAQVGLDKVDNTADSEKSVASANSAQYAANAGRAGFATSLDNPLIVEVEKDGIKGLYNFDGSYKTTIPLSADALGAAKTDLSNVDDSTLKEKVESVCTMGTPIVAATYIGDTTKTNSDGSTSITACNYSATVDGVTELTNGMEIIIIPDNNSTYRAITLNVNNLGAVPVRQPLSFTTFVATAPTRDGFLYGDTPCRLMYHANYASGGIWLMADKQKTSAQDLYGTTPVGNGGTGLSAVTANNFLVGDLDTKMAQKTPAEVLELIGAASLSALEALEARVYAIENPPEPLVITITKEGTSNGISWDLYINGSVDKSISAYVGTDGGTFTYENVTSAYMKVTYNSIGSASVNGVEIWNSDTSTGEIYELPTTGTVEITSTWMD